MNDDERTPVDVLIERLGTRIGQLTAQVEWLQVQLELAQAQNNEQPPEPSTNGEHQEVHA